MEKNEKHILTVIGCGDTFSSDGNTQTCFHVESSASTFLIDCGAGALAGLKSRSLSVADIDTIIISHFHGDHYGGLPYLLLDAAKEKRQEQLTIVSPPGCKEKVQQLLELLYPGSAVLENLNLHFIPYKEEIKIVLPHLTIKPFPVTHKIESQPHGVQICTAHKTIGFSGDTAWTDQLYNIAANTDLFICECCFYETAVDGHLRYLDLHDKIPGLQMKRILLTHFDDEMWASLDKINLPYAYDGLQLLF